MNEEQEPIVSPENQAEIDSIKKELKEDGGRERVNARIVESYISYINDLAAEKLSRDDE